MQNNRTISTALLSTALGALNTVGFKKLMEWMPYHEIALAEAVFLTLFFALLGGYKLKGTSPKSILYLFLGGLCGAFGSLFFYLALQYLPSIEFSFLGRNQVLISILLGILFLGERPSWIIGAAMVFALLGAFFFTFVSVDFTNVLGLFFAFLFCLAFASRGLLLKMGPKLDINSLMFWGSVLATLVVLGDIYWIEKVSLDVERTFFSSSTLMVIVISFLAQGIGLSLYFKAIYAGSFSTVSSVRATSPLFVACYSMFFFEYIWTASRLLGLLFSSTSILLFIFDQYRTKISLPVQSPQRQ